MKIKRNSNSNNNLLLRFQSFRGNRKLVYIFFVLLLIISILLYKLKVAVISSISKDSQILDSNILYLDNNLQNQISDICKDQSILTLNKPPFRVNAGKKMGEIVPISCTSSLTNFKKDCVSELKQMREWRNKHSYHYKRFEKAKIDFDRVNEVTSSFLKSRIKSYASLLSHASQKARFDTVTNDIINLHYMSGMTNIIDGIKMGECREQVFRTIINLSSLTENVKLQVVVVRNNNYRENHFFILINSDVSDITIQDNSADVQTILANMRNGYICDNWNEQTKVN